MSMIRRLFSRLSSTDPAEHARSEAVPPRALPSQGPSVSIRDAAASRLEEEEPYIEATSILDVLRVEETSDAEFFAGDLFRRRFGSNPPDFPRHFVAFYRDGRTRYWPVGYIHYTPYEDSYLCGGMVIDDRLYRRIAPPHRAMIKAAGGIAETMLRTTFARLRDAPAIWGYVGDKRAREVDLRVGFQPTDHPYIMVVWNRELPNDEKTARLVRIKAIGLF